MVPSKSSEHRSAYISWLKKDRSKKAKHSLFLFLVHFARHEEVYALAA